MTVAALLLANIFWSERFFPQPVAASLSKALTRYGADTFVYFGAVGGMKEADYLWKVLSKKGIDLVSDGSVMYGCRLVPREVPIALELIKADEKARNMFYVAPAFREAYMRLKPAGTN